MMEGLTINSLSGGKTSSYMAVHYTADYNIFALVTIEDKNCTPKDESIIKYVSDKIDKDFIATAESDTTLYAMRDLEQLLGKEIIWVSGNSFDKIIQKNNFLPSWARRYCTTEMKIRPIWDWWYKNINEKIKMGIGFRYDEMERAERLSISFKGVVGKRGTRNKWEEIEWREGYFPLIKDKITHYQVKKWADKSGLKFPSDSNCVGCFHKPFQQLRKNWDDETSKMQWFANQEKKPVKYKGEYVAQTFKDNKMTYEQIKTIGLQQDFFFGTGSGCQAGFCTD
jgi:hypothetical protein